MSKKKKSFPKKRNYPVGQESFQKSILGESAPWGSIG
jgi:hypothetical protein